MQNKFEQTLIKENQFLNSLNFNSFGAIGSNNFLNSTKAKSKIILSEGPNKNANSNIADDEAVRRNISEHINYVKLNFSLEYKFY